MSSQATSDSMAKPPFILMKHVTRSGKTYYKKKYKCTMCYEVYSKEKTIIEHMKRHTDEKALRCTVCNKGFPKMSSLRRHEMIHAGIKRCCEVCNKEVEVGGFPRHMKLHLNPGRYPCNLCDKTFNRRHGLRNHLQRRHPTEAGHNCSDCGESFQEDGLLREHQEHVHSTPTPVSCTVCHETFMRKSELQAHMDLTHAVEIVADHALSTNQLAVPSLVSKVSTVHTASPPRVIQNSQLAVSPSTASALELAVATIEEIGETETTAFDSVDASLLDHSFYTLATDLVEQAGIGVMPDITQDAGGESCDPGADHSACITTPGIGIFRNLVASSTTEVVEDATKTRNSRISATPAELTSDATLTTDVNFIADSAPVTSDAGSTPRSSQRLARSEDGLVPLVDPKGSKERRFQCPECKEAFLTKSLCERHIKTHTSVERKFQCDVCGKAFKQKDQLRCHRKVHTDPLICKVCGKKFTFQSALDSHSVVHTGKKPFECCYCNQFFPHRGDLNRHYDVHTKEGPFPCPVCSKPFSHLLAMTTHERLMHNKKSSFTCEECGRTFTHKRYLTDHYASHDGVNRHQCMLCLRKFKRRANLREHVKTHQGEKWYPCPLCKTYHPTVDELTQHIQNHPPDTGQTIDSADTQDNVEPKENPPAFPCTMCSLAFKTYGAFRNHVKIHDNKRVYPCQVCGLVFDTDVEVLEHMKTHVNVYSIGCAFQEDGGCTFVLHERKEENISLLKSNTIVIDGMNVVDESSQEEGGGESTCPSSKEKPHGFESSKLPSSSNAPAQTTVHKPSKRSSSEKKASVSSPGRSSEKQLQKCKLPSVSSDVPQELIGFHCNKCGAKFDDMTSLVQHVKDSHDDSPSPKKRSRRSTGKSPASPVHESDSPPPTKYAKAKASPGVRSKLKPTIAMRKQSDKSNSVKLASCSSVDVSDSASAAAASDSDEDSPPPASTRLKYNDLISSRTAQIMDSHDKHTKALATKHRSVARRDGPKNVPQSKKEASLQLLKDAGLLIDVNSGAYYEAVQHILGKSLNVPVVTSVEAVSSDGAAVQHDPVDEHSYCTGNTGAAHAEIREFRGLATSSTTEVVEDVAKMRNSRISAHNTQVDVASRKSGGFLSKTTQKLDSIEYRCPVCGRVFSQVNLLTEHLTQDHETGEVSTGDDAGRCDANDHSYVGESDADSAHPRIVKVVRVGKKQSGNATKRLHDQSKQPGQQPAERSQTSHSVEKVTREAVSQSDRESQDQSVKLRLAEPYEQMYQCPMCDRQFVEADFVMKHLRNFHKLQSRRESVSQENKPGGSNKKASSQSDDEHTATAVEVVPSRGAISGTVVNQSIEILVTEFDEKYGGRPTGKVTRRKLPNRARQLASQTQSHNKPLSRDGSRLGGSSGAQMYPCPLCVKQFARSHSLAEHLKTVHAADANPPACKKNETRESHSSSTHLPVATATGLKSVVDIVNTGDKVSVTEMREFRDSAASSTTSVVEDAAETRNSRISGVSTSGHQTLVTECDDMVIDVPNTHSGTVSLPSAEIHISHDESITCTTGKEMMDSSWDAPYAVDSELLTYVASDSECMEVDVSIQDSRHDESSPRDGAGKSVSGPADMASSALDNPSDTTAPVGCKAAEYWTTPRECILCDALFFTREKLVAHMKYSHAAKRPYPCCECNKYFASEKELFQHEISHSQG